MPPVLGPFAEHRFGVPRHDVRHPGRDLLVAARTAVRLRGRPTGHRAYHPVPVRPLLHRLDATARPLVVEGRRRVGAAVVTARAHAAIVPRPAGTLTAVIPEAPAHLPPQVPRGHQVFQQRRRRETGFAQLSDEAYHKAFDGNVRGWKSELDELVEYLDAA